MGPVGFFFRIIRCSLRSLSSSNRPTISVDPIALIFYHERQSIALELSMIGYLFNVHNDTQVEELGSMALDDDAAAIAFGKQVIRDLLDKDEEHCSGWTLEIAEGDRHVASIPFGADRIN
jgi:hypothetical protein